MPEQSGNWKPQHSYWLVAASVMLATFIEVMDTSIATVAVPYIAGSLSSSNDEATYVLTFYLLSNAVFLPSSTWFAQRFGRKRYLIASIAVFTVASFFVGSSTSLMMILLSRLVQGAGGGALQPLSQAIIQESFPSDKKGLGMAMFALGVVVAPVIGPTLGGWLTDTLSWRWAFYINLPVGALAMFMVGRYVEDPPYIQEAKPGRLDKVGLGMLAIGLGLMQIVLDRGQENDWFGATWIRVAVPVMIVMLISFCVYQFFARNPLVDLRVFKNRNFAVGCVLIFMFGASIYSVITLLPLFYQSLMGYTATASGLVVSPRGIGAVAVMPVVGFLSSRIDNRKIIATGFLVFASCSLLLGRIYLQISPYSMLFPIMLSGAGLGMIFVPLATTTLGGLPNEQVGNASGLFNLLRNIGGSVGIAVANTILARHEQLHRTELSYHLSSGADTLQDQLRHMTRFLESKVAAPTALSKTLALAQQNLTHQAQLWSYIDNFRYVSLLCFACVPIVFALKKVAGKAKHAA
jgi:DHA2 family multidrug resistance protein